MGLLLTIGLVVQSNLEYKFLDVSMEETDRSKDQVEAFLNEIQKEFQKRSITKTAVYYSYPDNRWTVQVIDEEFLEKHKEDIQLVLDEISNNMEMGNLVVRYRTMEPTS
ncbi:hypothetical protein [Halobacillus hunanensis]|uniref:hypothetical protein n=1 Tax=Halobacillus hunanensis TaxID=578214 RepID=UPI0009A6B3FE|nr:hypothetical protein [Halobacillus hunanensis]